MGKGEVGLGKEGILKGFGRRGFGLGVGYGCFGLGGVISFWFELVIFIGEVGGGFWVKVENCVEWER